MSQTASNSVPNNKSLSILIFTLIFSDVARLTLGVPIATEFPSEFDSVKEIVKPLPDTSSSTYWSLGDMISYGVQSVQSVIKYVIGVEDHPREFYVVHIKDEKNPNNNKDVLRERGREGKENDIPLKGGKLPGNSLIVNPGNPITEYVSSPEKTTPAPSDASDKPVPSKHGQSQIGNSISTTPATNVKHNNSPATNLSPSENEEVTLPSSFADTPTPSQKKDENEVPNITKSENAQLDQHDVFMNGVHDRSQMNSSPTTLKSNPQCTSMINYPSNRDGSKLTQHPGQNSISNSSHPTFPETKLVASQDEKVGQLASHGETKYPSKQKAGELQNLGNLLPMNVEKTIPTSSIRKETLSHEYNSSSDPFQNHHSNHTIDDEVIQPQVPKPPSPQHANLHQISTEVSESDISKILQPLANQTIKEFTPKDEEFPENQHGGRSNNGNNLEPSSKIEETQPFITSKADSHILEPSQQKPSGPPSSDSNETMPINECEMKFEKQLCEKHPDICDQFQTDEEFSDYIKQNSSCAADGQEKNPLTTTKPYESAEPQYDPNELISISECETEFERELCEKNSDICDQFQSNEEFIAYVKENSGCEARGQKKTPSPTNDPGHSTEPSSFDPNELISMNECETEFERELCSSDPDFCGQFQSDEQFIDYVKQNSGCVPGGQETGGRHPTEHDIENDDPAEHYSHDLEPPENFDGQNVPNYDNDVPSNPQLKPSESTEKKNSGTKKKSKSSKEKRSKSKS